MNHQPPNDPTAPPADPTAVQPVASDPTAVQPSSSQPGASEWPAPAPAGFPQPAPPYGTQPAPPYGAPFDAAPYGTQPPPAYGAQPGMPYGAQSGPGYGTPAFPAPGSSPYPPPGSGGTSGFAIASLIFGILGGVLLSVIFGIVALVQMRKRGQKGRGLAISGLVLSGCWLLLIIIGATYGIITGSDDKSASNTGSGSVSVTTLKRGDCVNGISTAGAIEDLPVVSCSAPHQGEVYAVFELTAGPWPGDDVVQQQAESRCNKSLESYAPKAADTVEVLYLHPLERSWSRDRGVTCVATDERGTTTGSIRD